MVILYEVSGYQTLFPQRACLAISPGSSEVSTYLSFHIFQGFLCHSLHLRRTSSCILVREIFWQHFFFSACVFISISFWQGIFCWISSFGLKVLLKNIVLVRSSWFPMGNTLSFKFFLELGM